MQNFNDNKSTIPKYLEELIKPTPLSVEKLLAAWDGLSFETQLMILSEYVSTYPVAYKLRISLAAIKSKNVYLRFIAHENGENTLDFNLSHEKSELLNEIRLIGKNDESNLISGKKLANCISGFTCTPEEFFNLTNCERIQNVSLIKKHGKQVAEFIEYYYKNAIRFTNITDNHIFDILWQYFGGKHFLQYKSTEMSYDGYAEFSNGKDVLALWNLVPIVPETIAFLLIENLPAKSGFEDFTKDVIPSLSEKYFIRFLSNKNNYVCDFRKSIFVSDLYSNDVKEAAITYNFSLMDHEFLDIVKYEPIKRSELIQKLVFASDLSISISKAIIDLLKLENGIDYMLIRCCEQGIKRKLKQLSPENQLYHLNVIRLYEIAKRILPWNQKDAREVNFESEVDFLQINTKGLNTWEIFIKIRDRFERVYKNEEITLHLAEMVDLDEEADFPKANYDTFLLKRILKSQHEIFIKTTQPKQPNYLNDFKREILSTINKENENQNSILNKFNDSIKNIENLISAICFNTKLIGVKFWLFFAFVTVSFFSGFGLHWFMTK